MAWAPLIQAVAPLGVDLVEFVIELIKKEATGEPITPSDWKNLIVLYASKTADQRFDELLDATCS